MTKCLFKIGIGFVDPLINAALDRCMYQCSVSMLSQDLFGVVTGPNKYLFMKIADNFQHAEVSLSDLDTRSNLTYEPPPVHGISGISTNYTCHAWTLDTGRLVVGTDMGDILLMDYEGQFLQYLVDSPRGHCIDSMFAYNRGLIVGAKPGWLWTYEAQMSEEYPYKLIKGKIGEADTKANKIPMDRI